MRFVNSPPRRALIWLGMLAAQAVCLLPGGQSAAQEYRVYYATPGSEPTPGQLRGYPLFKPGPSVAAIPGDPAGVYKTPLVPDITYVGPRPYSAGYRDLNRFGRRRLFPTPPGGTGLPLILNGGFFDNTAPIEFTYPAYPVFSGYLGSVAPAAPLVVPAAP
jgi:hypothetical protein